MTRWLAAAKTASPPKVKTDNTDKTLLASSQNEVSSVSSVSSEGGSPCSRQAGTHPSQPAAILECDAGLSREEAEPQAAGGDLSAMADIPKRTASAAKGDLRRDMKFDPVAHPGDPETYVEALRVHGPMSYGMAMRVLGWGGSRAGQAETALRASGCITLNNHGRAVLTGAQS